MSTESKIITSTIVILLILAGAFYFLAPDSLKFWGDQTANTIDSANDDSETATPHERITAKHQYKNGTHIVAGEVNMPTPCYILNVSSRIVNGEAIIDFVSETNGEMCAEVITTERFRVDFTAEENVVIKGTWNGEPVELNLIPAGANEDLTNFEIFVK